MAENILRISEESLRQSVIDMLLASAEESATSADSVDYARLAFVLAPDSRKVVNTLITHLSEYVESHLRTLSKNDLKRHRDVLDDLNSAPAGDLDLLRRTYTRAKVSDRLCELLLEADPAELTEKDLGDLVRFVIDRELFIEASPPVTAEDLVKTQTTEQRKELIRAIQAGLRNP
jgi:hypothetical protein